MSKLKYIFFVFVTLFGAVTMLSSCSSSDDNEFKADYDVFQINGESYACYGYRSPVTYTSEWNLSTHTGELRLPCGKLSDAQKGEYNYEYMYCIYLEGNENLKRVVN